MSNELALKNTEEALAKVILEGDLSKLSAIDKVKYYKGVCESQGMNPLTQPFKFIRFRDGKEQLYAGKDCTEQLRKMHNITLKITSRELMGDVYIVTASAATREGRVDESTGVRAIKGLHGDALANAYMSAETKAKRRVTLSICGLGFLDESETHSVDGASTLHFDIETGEVIEAEKPKVSKTLVKDNFYKESSEAEEVKSLFISQDQVFELSKLIFDAGAKTDNILQAAGAKNLNEIPVIHYDRICDKLFDKIRQDTEAQGNV